MRLIYFHSLPNRAAGSHLLCVLFYSLVGNILCAFVYVVIVELMVITVLNVR